MDASYKIQRGIHVHLIQFFMCPEFWVHIMEANRPAAALYESFGFRFTGERDTHGERVMCLRTR